MLGRREHRDRIGGTGRAQIRAFERIDGNVDLRKSRHGGTAQRVSQPDFFADVEHRRLVALAFTDDDRSVDRHRVHDLPHGFDSHLIGFVAVALAHRVRAGDGRLLDDAQELERKI